jgi:hypothetical protein
VSRRQGQRADSEQWCGHAQLFLVMPHADGERAALVPIFGEAA